MNVSLLCAMFKETKDIRLMKLFYLVVKADYHRICKFRYSRLLYKKESCSLLLRYSNKTFSNTFMQKFADNHFDYNTVTFVRFNNFSRIDNVLRIGIIKK